MSWGGENLCHKAECPDLCCLTMHYQNVPIDERKRVYPNATKVGNYGEICGAQCGVYVIENESRGGVESIYMAGGCINRTAEGCNGNRTGACPKFTMGGKECNELRKKNGLYPIDTEGNPLPRKKFLGII